MRHVIEFDNRDYIFEWNAQVETDIPGIRSVGFDWCDDVEARLTKSRNAYKDRSGPRSDGHGWKSTRCRHQWGWHKPAAPAVMSDRDLCALDQLENNLWIEYVDWMVDHLQEETDLDAYGDRIMVDLEDDQYVEWWDRVA